MPNQAGSYFADTVTYLCRHDDDGALGIISNRPVDVSFATLLEQIGVASSAAPSLPVLRGGPVNEDQGLLLHSSDERFGSSDALGNDLHLSYSREILAAIGAGQGPKQALFALGYAGWGAGQLESEIEQHAWLSLDADPRILFEVPVAERLAHAQALAGADLQLLSGRIGHD